MDQIIDIDPGPENGIQNETSNNRITTSVTSNNTLKTEPKVVKKNNYFPDVILHRHNKVDAGTEKGVREKKFSLLTLVIIINRKIRI